MGRGMSTTQQICTGLTFPGGVSFQKYLDSIPGLIQWPIQDLPPSTTALARFGGGYDSSFDGTHASVTLGQTAPGNLGYAGLYDANNDYTDIQTAALASAWNGSEWSIFGFARHDGAVGTTRRIISLSADGSNYVLIAINTGGSIQVDYNAGGTSKTRAVALPSATDMFMFMAIRSASGNLSLSIDAGTASTTSGAGVWAGSFAASIIGGGSPTTLLWDGLITRVGIANNDLSSIEDEIYSRSGI